jgi:hypothetical protein
LQPLETGEDKNRFSIAPGGREALMMSWFDQVILVKFCGNLLQEPLET